MKTKVSKKKVIILSAFFIAAFIVCVFLCFAQNELSERRKRDEAKTESYLTGAIEALDAYIGGVEGEWNHAAEQLHSYYTMNDYLSGVNAVWHEKPNSQTLEEIRLLSIKMLNLPDELKQGAEKLHDALGLLAEDQSSQEAARMISELLEGNLTNIE